MTGSDDEVVVCLRVLERLRGVPADDAARKRVEHAVAGFVKDGKRVRRAARRRARPLADTQLDSSTLSYSSESPPISDADSHWVTALATMTIPDDIGSEASAVPVHAVRCDDRADEEPVPADEKPVSVDDVAVCLRVLERLRAAPPDDAARRQAEYAVAGFVKDGKKARRAARRRASATADAAVLAETVMGAADRPEDLAVAEPGPGEVGVLRRDRRCYVCKSPYRRVDGRYHWLCPPCADDNGRRRDAGTDLRGRYALLTGGRVKIGFQVALRLLRDGASVTVTTRFPRDALRRFAAAPGAAGWWERLDVVGIDLRDPRQVLALCAQLHERGRPLDILVNNAAQTVRRPAWAYAPLVAGEAQPLPALPGPPRLALVAGYAPTLPAPDWVAALPSAADTGRVGALAAVDAAGLLPDSAPANSWSARVGEVDPAELLEVQLVNAVAPFLLLDRLRPLLAAAPHPRRYVVNVTAVEGWFAAPYKGPGHPHTNMAKAALNMLTRTAAAELAAHGIYVSSVDTGWITDENPAPKKDRIAGTGWRPPLDVADGAARVYDPIVRGEAGSPVYGVLLKDYRPVPW